MQRTSLKAVLSYTQSPQLTRHAALPFWSRPDSTCSLSPAQRQPQLDESKTVVIKFSQKHELISERAQWDGEGENCTLSKMCEWAMKNYRLHSNIRFPSWRGFWNRNRVLKSFKTVVSAFQSNDRPFYLNKSKQRSLNGYGTNMLWRFSYEVIWSKRRAEYCWRVLKLDFSDNRIYLNGRLKRFKKRNRFCTYRSHGEPRELAVAASEREMPVICKQLRSIRWAIHRNRMGFFYSTCWNLQRPSVPRLLTVTRTKRNVWRFCKQPILLVHWSFQS